MAKEMPPSDSIPEGERSEILREISARNQTDVVELSKFAARVEEATRQNPDTDRYRLEYHRHAWERDEDRGRWTRSHRRLDGKTQMCTAPKNDHVMNRLTHVGQVASVAERVARGLGLNEKLARAIGLHHDIGHIPLGHYGELLLTRTLLDRGFLPQLGAFKHNIHGLHVVDRVERRNGMKAPGLNLTHQVRDGILAHDGEKNVRTISPDRQSTPEEYEAKIRAYIMDIIRASAEGAADPNAKTPEEQMEAIKDRLQGVSITPSTLEGCVVLMSDSLAYIPSDIEDLVRLGVMDPKELPSEFRRRLGSDSGHIVNALVTDLLVHSYGKDQIGYSKEVGDMLLYVKSEVLYPRYFRVNSWVQGSAKDARIKIAWDEAKLQERMDAVFDYCMTAVQASHRFAKTPIIANFLEDKDDQPYYGAMWYLEGAGQDAIDAQTVVDYIAGFTDRYFVEQSEMILSHPSIAVP